MFDRFSIPDTREGQVFPFPPLSNTVVIRSHSSHICFTLGWAQALAMQVDANILGLPRVEFDFSLVNHNPYVPAVHPTIPAIRAEFLNRSSNSDPASWLAYSWFWVLPFLFGLRELLGRNATPYVHPRHVRGVASGPKPLEEVGLFTGCGASYPCASTICIDSMHSYFAGAAFE